VDRGARPRPIAVPQRGQGDYATGNESKVRNQILDAKRWAVKNNVAAIRNDLGVYDVGSRLEDRARYYTDLMDVFGELQIPWQIWFMTMDPATGAVAPEHKSALRL
jgi:hypothetical protein